METSKEYYDRIMSDYKSKGARRSLRKYCMDEGVDYQWLVKAQKEYSSASKVPGTSSRFIPLSLEEADPGTNITAGQEPAGGWRVRRMVLAGPYGEVEISGGSLSALLPLMEKLK